MAEIIAQDEYEVRFIRTPEQYAIGVRVKSDGEDWSEQILLTAGQVDEFIQQLQVAQSQSQRAAMRELARAKGADDAEMREFIDEALPLDDETD